MNLNSFSDSTGTPDAKPSDADIVVGWDRTPAARAALREGVALAALTHAHLHVAHIADDSDLGIDPDSPTWEEQTRAISDANAKWVRSALADTPYGWTYYSARGSAAAVLGAVAAKSGADTVVIGAHRHGVAALLSRLTRRPLVEDLTDRGLVVVVVPAAK